LCGGFVRTVGNLIPLRIKSFKASAWKEKISLKESYIRGKGVQIVLALDIRDGMDFTR
jgi:hypothetical protein